MIYMVSTIFLRTFLLIFFGLPVFDVVSSFIRLILMSCCFPMHDKYGCSPARHT